MSDPYTYDPNLAYEVRMCGMRVDENGDHVYASGPTVEFWSVYAVESQGDTNDILEDEDFDIEEAAGRRAEELIAKYGGVEKCAFEFY